MNEECSWRDKIDFVWHEQENEVLTAKDSSENVLRKCSATETAGSKKNSCAENGVMRSVIGTTCVLSDRNTNKDSDEEDECSDGLKQKFDVYIVNDRGKVNGYELKCIGSMGDNAYASEEEQKHTTARFLRCCRKTRAIPPTEFYGRKRQNEVLRKHTSISESTNKERCEPIILEISEIYGKNGENVITNENTWSYEKMCEQGIASEDIMKHLEKAMLCYNTDCKDVCKCTTSNVTTKGHSVKAFKDASTALFTVENSCDTAVTSEKVPDEGKEFNSVVTFPLFTVSKDLSNETVSNDILEEPYTLRNMCEASLEKFPMAKKSIEMAENANRLTYPDTITFVEDRTSAYTRNNKVGKLVKFFEELGDKSESMNNAA